jgi:hypothetical protein
MKKKKKKSYSSFNTLQDIRRNNEIRENGKMVSLRPSIVMKSKKDYKRKWNLKDYIDGE